VKEQIKTECNMSKVEAIGYLQKSVDFFKTNESFNSARFEQDVFEDDTVKAKFNDFKDSYARDRAVNFDANFEIARPAVKKQSRRFKSILKLDQNFEIQIHGNEGLIERGYDETAGKFYYKVYFDKES
jgi:hypothetical protein